MPLLESKGSIFTLHVPRVCETLPQSRGVSLPRAFPQAEGPVLGSWLRAVWSTEWWDHGMLEWETLGGSSEPGPQQDWV